MLATKLPFEVCTGSDVSSIDCFDLSSTDSYNFPSIPSIFDLSHSRLGARYPQCKNKKSVFVQRSQNGSLLVRNFEYSRIL
jgi:hypothetical protein